MNRGLIYILCMILVIVSSSCSSIVKEKACVLEPLPVLSKDVKINITQDSISYNEGGRELLQSYINTRNAIDECRM